jgi:hypothetical protein
MSGDNRATQLVTAIGGDGLGPSGWHRYRLSVPGRLLGTTEFVVDIRRLSGGESECADVDDVALVRFEHPTRREVLLGASFESDLGPFEASEGGPAVSRGLWHGQDAVAISGGSDASISAAVPITGAAPGDLLRAHWVWRANFSTSLGWHDYVTAEMSTNDGASWVQLAGTGMNQAPEEWTSAGALLPPEAWELGGVMLRFRAPITAQQDDSVPIYIADVQVVLQHPPLRAETGEVQADPEGTYTSALDLTAPGRRTLFCEWSCGDQVLVSNTIDVEVLPE